MRACVREPDHLGSFTEFQSEPELLFSSNWIIQNIVKTIGLIAFHMDSNGKFEKKQRKVIIIISIYHLCLPFATRLCWIYDTDPCCKGTSLKIECMYNDEFSTQLSWQVCPKLDPCHRNSIVDGPLKALSIKLAWINKNIQIKPYRPTWKNTSFPKNYEVIRAGGGVK